MGLFPYNLQSYFFCMSTRMLLPHRNIHMNLWLSCIKSLLLFQHSPGKNRVYQVEMGTSCILAHTILSLLVSSHKLQSWIQMMEFWLRKKILLFLLFINDNKIIMHHYLCIGWSMFRARVWISKSLKCKISRGAGPANLYNLIWM